MEFRNKIKRCKMFKNETYWCGSDWPDEEGVRKVKLASFFPTTGTLIMCEADYEAVQHYKATPDKNQYYKNPVRAFEEYNKRCTLAMRDEEDATQVIEFRPFSGEEEKKLWEKVSTEIGRVKDMRARASQRTKKRKKAEYNYLMGYEFSDPCVVSMFMEGKTEGRHNNLHIDGDSMKYYSGLLVKRLGNGEYMLGRELSGCMKNCSSSASRVLSSLMRYKDVTFWPSTLAGYWSHHNRNAEDHEFIFDWCLKVFRYVQWKYPTCRKPRKEAMIKLREEAIRTYNKALKKWPVNKEVHSEVKELCAVFDDIKEMKVINNAKIMESILEEAVK
jgi:hypothetical protein